MVARQGDKTLSENSRAFERGHSGASRRTLSRAQILAELAAGMIATFARPARAQPGGLTMSVRAVIDGDTVRIGRKRVSLLGIRAPTLGDASTEPFARQARERLSSLVVLRYVRLEFDGAQRGRAYLFTEDGVFVNAEIVRAGLARVTGPPTLKRLDVLRAAEAEARSARRGLWSVAPR